MSSHGAKSEDEAKTIPAPVNGGLRETQSLADSTTNLGSPGLVSTTTSAQLALEKQWSTSNLERGKLQLGFDTSSPVETDRKKRQGKGVSSSFTSTMMDPIHPGLLRPSLGSRTFSQGAIRSAVEDDGITVSSVIHDAARITNWRSVRALCATHPHCARYTGQDRWTALHHACSRRCPDADVIEALLRAYPDALLQLDEKGFLPLHHACRHKAPKEVVRLLLFLFPEKGVSAASRRCNRGRTSLHYAIRYDAPPGVMEMLVEAEPRAVLEEDRDGVSPLGLVWDKYATSFEGKRTLHPFLKHFETVLDTESSPHAARVGITQFKEEKEIFQKLPSDEKLRKKWDKANTLLRAAFHFPITDGNDTKPSGSSDAKKRKWRILHATSATKCHLTLFQLACVLHTEQAFEIDEGDLFGFGGSAAPVAVKSGKTALHFAAASPFAGRDAKTIISILLALNKEAATKPDAVDESLPLHIISDNERKAHWAHDGVKDIYLANTSAVGSRDRKGRTPLHRASSIVSQRAIAVSIGNVAAPGAGDTGSIIQHLVQLHPRAASIADNTNRLPLHYMAEHGEGWNGDIEAVLEAHRPALRSRVGAQAFNRLPLHMAAASTDAKASLVAGLVKANPRAASQADARGKLPLQIACESGRSWEAGIDAIFAAYEPAVREREDNDRGWLALHMAASSPNAATGLISKLCEVSPEAAGVTDRSNRYPLHVACAAGKAWVGNLEAIFRANPTAAFEADQFGLYPFHVAAMSFAVPPNSSPTPLRTFTPMAPRPTALGRRAVSAIVESKRGSASLLPRPEPLNQKSEERGTSSSHDAVMKIDVLFHLLQTEPNVLKFNS